MMPATCRPLPAPVPSPRNQPRRNRTAASVSSAAALPMSQDGSTFHEPARWPLWASTASTMDASWAPDRVTSAISRAGRCGRYDSLGRETAARAADREEEGGEGEEGES